MKKQHRNKKMQDQARLKTIKLAERVSSTHLLSAIIGMGDIVNVYTTTGTPTNLTLDQMIAIGRTPLPWNFSFYAICRDNQGKDYIKSIGLKCLSPVRRGDVATSLSAYHYDWMERECNINHVLTLAWIESTGEEPSDALAMDIFTKTGVWEKFKPLARNDEGHYITNAA